MLNMDEQWMARALELAGEAIYRTSPNPRVGCVLVNAEGMVIGEGGPITVPDGATVTIGSDGTVSAALPGTATVKPAPRSFCWAHR